MKNRILLLIGILLIASLLRLWRIDSIPVSLFGDELDVGYQAYSILKTGKDYSGNPWPLHFHSLAEWRTPLYLYLSVPTVALFGISPLGVRLPAAVFGIISVGLFYLVVRELFKKESIALVAALLLAISPWHIQYSRAAFELTQLFMLFLGGIYCFLRGIKDGKWLPISAVCFSLTPWVYSTAKLFTPLFLVLLLILWKTEIIKVGKKWLIWSLVMFLFVGGPIAYSTAFGGGTARFNYLSIFTDPTVIPEVGFSRLNDAKVRNEKITFGMQSKLIDRVFHNKINAWVKIFTDNYIKAFSFNFLFIKGDLNLRHSIDRLGMFYKIDSIFLLIGFALFLTSRTVDARIKWFLFLWILLAPIPASLTRDGGNHASRLFFMLAPLVMLIAYGLYEFVVNFPAKFIILRRVLIVAILALYGLHFALYQHNYWYHYPWESERWWHAGYREAITSAKDLEKQYDKIIISTNGEPPWIFFAGWYEFPPDKWQKNFPFPKTTLNGYGEISYIDKYYFGSPALKSGIYSLAEFLDEKTLYIANGNEFNMNLILEPGRLPKNIRMIKAIPYPSGEPAFYLLTYQLPQ